MQLPIMAGVTVKDGSFATSYPINLEPRASDNGLSKGQLVSTRGAEVFGTGPGTDRGGIDWNGTLYRVMGSSFVKVDSDGTATVIGEVGNNFTRCSFAYGFDRLGVRSAGRLFYYNGLALSEVTDPDLGEVIDLEWMDGYFVTTDGTYIVVTELLDPTAVDPIKYGSAEEDPDMIVGIRKFREELYAFGRYSIQVFQNVGGLGFPFQVTPGATIPYGAVGANAITLVGGSTFAFVGGGKDEPPGVLVYTGGTAQRISSKEIDDLIAAHPSPELIEIESRSFGGERQIIVHLEDRSVGIALATSAEADQGAWFVLNSGLFAPYRLRNAVWCYGKHIVGDTESVKLGVLSLNTSQHFTTDAHWQFDSAITFGEGAGYIVGEVELFGQFPTAENAVYFSMTRDGVTHSREVARRLSGRRGERVVWRPNVRMPMLSGFRWRGTGKVSIARCDMAAEPLAV